jgi:hypothetical protein
MVISMCEEVQRPATQVPKAMVVTIIINTIGGLLFLVPLMFVLPDLAMLVSLSSGQPVPTIIKSAVGSSGGAIALLVPLMVLAILCGVACTTAASRCTWAFARDGAIPGSKWWKQVHPKLDLPLNAMILSTVIQILLGLIYFGSYTAFNAFSGVGVISLTVSYAAPIAVSMLEGRAHVKGAKFSLGKIGWFCNGIAMGMCHASPRLLLRVLAVGRLANWCFQPGLSSPSPSSACPLTSPSRPQASTMRLWCLSASLSSPLCGTPLGGASTTAARPPRASAWILFREATASPPPRKTSEHAAFLLNV